MKKFFSLIFFLLFLPNIKASNSTEVYISKRDALTNLYINDSNFAIYDSDNKIVDTWDSKDEDHVVSLEVGNYKLIETPILNDTLAYTLSNYYNLSVDSDEVIKLTLYNKKIETPKNLGYTGFNIYIGGIFVFLGLLIILYRKISLN